MRKQTPKRNTKGGFVEDRSNEYNQNMLKVEKPPQSNKPQQQQSTSKINQSHMSNFTQKSNNPQPRAHLVSHGSSGDGLWCVVKEEDYYEPGKYDQIAQKAINRKAKVVGKIIKLNLQQLKVQKNNAKNQDLIQKKQMVQLEKKIQKIYNQNKLSIIQIKLQTNK